MKKTVRTIAIYIFAAAALWGLYTTKTNKGAKSRGKRKGHRAFIDRSYLRER